MTIKRLAIDAFAGKLAERAINVAIVRPRVKPPQRLSSVFGALENHQAKQSRQ